MVRGEQRGWFAAGVALGVFVPGVLAIVALAADTLSPGLLLSMALPAIAGVFAAETAFVRAGQSVPLS